ncbi:MAG: biopolymer transporter ExbD [Verrucomicrobiae bacterium]|jgi:biopolymer transport protein ExbD|nr:biopolymer transporter ExbD [Verrucomicrobiae bacterium]
MRRFSKRNSLVTLNEINVTPLLDLAFVLLIIFIITTPMLESSVDLNLPVGQSESHGDPKKEDIHVVEIDRRGYFWLDKQYMPLEHVEYYLAAIYQTNRNLIVSVRADKDGRVEPAIQLIDRCMRRGISQISFATELQSQ